ncbi:Ig-like domain-containing protein [Candidatus Nomurabacteria bacterium]|nr:Ig-like domain-containing protein [Candidatus Nomurabacteria bacterium]
MKNKIFIFCFVFLLIFSLFKYSFAGEFSIISSDPVDNSTNVSVNIKPIIKFSKEFNPDSINDKDVQLRIFSVSAVDATAVPVAFDFAENNTLINIKPLNPLEYNKQYYIYADSGIKDLNGDSMVSADRWLHSSRSNHEFTTENIPLVLPPVEIPNPLPDPIPDPTPVPEPILDPVIIPDPVVDPAPTPEPEPEPEIESEPEQILDPVSDNNNQENIPEQNIHRGGAGAILLAINPVQNIQTENIIPEISDDTKEIELDKSIEINTQLNKKENNQIIMNNNIKKDVEIQNNISNNDVTASVEETKNNKYTKKAVHHFSQGFLFVFTKAYSLFR